ncbi:tail fiber assembly protein [Rhodanobacter sp. OR92]|uniref:tail fiber assembly protein n=1 Tax=Rhodanobacter sp. OR92 TaxID=1076524 RepID=UPI0004106ACA|nr:tail fiber assembly protein [Rhodanobacter sp. OR92]
MYAITTTSFRAIASADDVQPGETAVDVLPESLLTALHAAEMRLQRDRALRNCDWTQSADSPLEAATQAAWATYRQALRDVPEQAGFPETIDWPVAPAA